VKVYIKLVCILCIWVLWKATAKRILDFAGNHFQRFRYIAKRGCDAVSWNFPYIPGSGTDLEC
jgi:hypothetical protein